MRLDRCAALGTFLAVFLLAPAEKGAGPFSGIRSVSAEGDEAAAAALARAAEALKNIRDYTAVATKQERVASELLPRETFLIKQRREPDCLYLKWLPGPYQGREAIYCRPRYGDDLKVHEGSPPSSWLGTLTLDPRGNVAMDGNRHSLDQAGIFHLLGAIFADAERAKGHPEHGVRIESLHEEAIGDQASICWTKIQPSDRKLGYYAPRVEICLHRDLHLPTRLRVWDDPSQLLEAYTYGDYKLNVGLTDADFDVANQSYGF